MENNYTNINAEANNTAENSESIPKSFGEMLGRILVETPKAMAYTHSILNSAIKASEKRYTKVVGRNIPAPLQVDAVCEAVITVFKNPDCPVDKDMFLRGAVTFMLAHQMDQTFENQTGKSNKKEEFNG